MEQFDLLEARIDALLATLVTLQEENSTSKEKQEQAFNELVQENTLLREQLAEEKEVNQKTLQRVAALISRIKDSTE